MLSVKDSKMTSYQSPLFLALFFLLRAIFYLDGCVDFTLRDLQPWFITGLS